MKLSLISQSESKLNLSKSIEVKTDGLSIKRESGANATNVLLIKDPHISSNHSEIFYADGSFFISDNNSANGTFVNIPMKTQLILEKGMEIDMGNHTYNIVEAEKSTIKIEINSHDPDNDENNSSYNFKLKKHSDCFLVIGKKKPEGENFICLDDSDLENKHAKIIYDGTNLILEPFENRFG